MMWRLPPLALSKRAVALALVIGVLLGMFVWVLLRSGPLAPVKVVEHRVNAQPLAPVLYGIGTVEARFKYKIGPTVPGRVKTVTVHAGELVRTGQVLAEMDPVDLDAKLRAQSASMHRAQAQLEDANARLAFARAQAGRYAELLRTQTVSREMASAKQQDFAAAQAAAVAAKEEIRRVMEERNGLQSVKNSLVLRSPSDGVVSLRNAEPGSTVVAGQSVVELIDPNTLWVNTRFDQLQSSGLRTGLPAISELRSRPGSTIRGRVVLVEPLADSVTEEMVAKVRFDQRLPVVPPIGELVEVRVVMPRVAARPVIPNSSLLRSESGYQVWLLKDGNKPERVAVTLGDSDLDGNVQVLAGVQAGDRIVSHSERPLGSKTRVRIVPSLLEHAQ